MKVPVLPEGCAEKNRLWARIWPMIFFFGLSSWPLFLYFFKGETIYSNSQLNFSLPLRYNALQTILKGNLPLWNPHMFNGMPLLADASSMPFDPFGILLVFFEPVVAFVLLPTVQLFLAGSFMYIYLYKGLGLRKLPSLVGGCLAVLNPVLIFGFGVPLDNHIPFQGILFLPLVMFFVERAIWGDGSSTILNSIYTGLILSIIIFSTYPNIAFFIGAFIFFYLLFYSTALRKKVQIFAISGFVAVLLSCIQVLPTLEVIKSSHRTLLWEPAVRDLYGYSLTSMALSFFHGMLKIFGLPAGFKYYHPFYLGIFNTLLLILAYTFKATRYSLRTYKKLFAFLLLLMILSYYLPLKGMIAVFLPFVRGLRIGHMAFVVYFCAFILISKSFENIVYGQNEKKLQLKTTYAYFIISVLACILILCIHKKTVLVLRELLNDITPAFYIIPYIIIFLFSFKLLLVLLKDNEKRVKIPVVLLLFIAGNLCLVWHRSFLTVSSTQLKDMYDKTEETEFLRRMTPLERMGIYYGQNRWKWNQAELKQGCTMNLPLFFGVSISGGQLPMHHYRDRIFFDAVNGRYPFSKEWYWKDGHYIRDSGRAYLEEKALQNNHMINLLGINYIFSAEKLSLPFLELIEQGSSYYIYKNKQALPRNFLVTHQAVLENDEEILKAIYENHFDLRKIVFCTDKILTDQSVQSKNVDFHTSIESYKSNFIRLNVKTPEEAIVVLTDSYNAGWSVYVDGKPDTIHRVNYKFRGIRIDPGKHIITLRYLPKRFVVGAIASSTSLLFQIIAIILIKIWPKTKQLDSITDHGQAKSLFI